MQEYKRLNFTLYQNNPTQKDAYLDINNKPGLIIVFLNGGPHSLGSLVQKTG